MAKPASLQHVQAALSTAIEWGPRTGAGCPQGARAAVEEAQGLLKGGLIDKVLKRLTAIVDPRQQHVLGQPLSVEPKAQASGDAEGANRGSLSAGEWAEAASRESCSLLLVLLLALRLEAQTQAQAMAPPPGGEMVAASKGHGDLLRKVLGCIIPLALVPSHLLPATPGLATPECSLPQLCLTAAAHAAVSQAQLLALATILQALDFPGLLAALSTTPPDADRAAPPAGVSAADLSAADKLVGALGAALSQGGGLRMGGDGLGAGAEEPQAGAAVLLAWAAYASLSPAQNEASAGVRCAAYLRAALQAGADSQLALLLRLLQSLSADPMNQVAVVSVKQSVITLIYAFFAAYDPKPMVDVAGHGLSCFLECACLAYEGQDALCASFWDASYAAANPMRDFLGLLRGLFPHSTLPLARLLAALSSRAPGAGAARGRQRGTPWHTSCTFEYLLQPGPCAVACSIPQWVLESAMEEARGGAGEGAEAGIMGGGGEGGLVALAPISCPGALPFPQAPQLLIPPGTCGRVTKALPGGQFLVLWDCRVSPLLVLVCQAVNIASQLSEAAFRGALRPGAASGSLSPSAGEASWKGLATQLEAVLVVLVNLAQTSRSIARSVGNIAEGPALRVAQESGCVAQNARLDVSAIAGALVSLLTLPPSDSLALSHASLLALKLLTAMAPEFPTAVMRALHPEPWRADWPATTAPALPHGALGPWAASALGRALAPPDRRSPGSVERTLEAVRLVRALLGAGVSPSSLGSVVLYCAHSVLPNYGSWCAGGSPGLHWHMAAELLDLLSLAISRDPASPAWWQADGAPEDSDMGAGANHLGGSVGRALAGLLRGDEATAKGLLAPLLHLQNTLQDFSFDVRGALEDAEVEAEAEGAGGKLGHAVLACLRLLNVMLLRMLPQALGAGGRIPEAQLEGAMRKAHLLALLLGSQGVDHPPQQGAPLFATIAALLLHPRKDIQGAALGSLQALVELPGSSRPRPTNTAPLLAQHPRLVADLQEHLGSLLRGTPTQGGSAAGAPEAQAHQPSTGHSGCLLFLRACALYQPELLSLLVRQAPTETQAAGGTEGQRGAGTASAPGTSTEAGRGTGAATGSATKGGKDSGAAETADSGKRRSTGNGLEGPEVGVGGRAGGGGAPRSESAALAQAKLAGPLLEALQAAVWDLKASLSRDPGAAAALLQFLVALWRSHSAPMASLRAHLASGPASTQKQPASPGQGAAGLWAELGSVLRQAVTGAEQSLRECQRGRGGQSARGTSAGAGEALEGLQSQALQRCAAQGSAAASALELAALDLFLHGHGTPQERASPLSEARQTPGPAERPSSAAPRTPGAAELPSSAAPATPGAADLLPSVEDLLGEEAPQRSTGGASTSGRSHKEGRAEGAPLLWFLVGAEPRHVLHASRTRALAQAGATCALLMACSLSGNLWAMAPAMAARIADTTHQFLQHPLFQSLAWQDPLLASPYSQPSVAWGSGPTAVAHRQLVALVEIFQILRGSATGSHASHGARNSRSSGATVAARSLSPYGGALALTPASPHWGGAAHHSLDPERVAAAAALLATSELPLELLRPLEGAVGDRLPLAALAALEPSSGAPGAAGPVPALLQALGLTQDPSLLGPGRGGQGDAGHMPADSLGAGSEEMSEWKLPAGCLQGSSPMLVQTLSQMLQGAPESPVASQGEMWGASAGADASDGQRAGGLQEALERELHAGVAALETVQHSCCVEQAQQDVAVALPLFLAPALAGAPKGSHQAPPRTLAAALAAARALTSTVLGASAQHPSASHGGEEYTGGAPETPQGPTPLGFGRVQVAKGLVQALVLLSERAVADASAQRAGVGVQALGEGKGPLRPVQEGIVRGGQEGGEGSGREGLEELAGALAECVCCCCGDERGSLSPLLDERSFLLLLGPLQGALLASAEPRGLRQWRSLSKPGQGRGGVGQEGEAILTAYPWLPTLLVALFRQLRQTEGGAATQILWVAGTVMRAFLVPSTWLPLLRIHLSLENVFLPFLAPGPRNTLQGQSALLHFCLALAQASQEACELLLAARFLHHFGPMVQSAQETQGYIQDTPADAPGLLAWRGAVWEQALEEPGASLREALGRLENWRLGVLAAAAVTRQLLPAQAHRRGSQPGPESGTLLAIEAEGGHAKGAPQGASPSAASAACQSALLELLSSEHSRIMAALSVPRSSLLGSQAGAPAGVAFRSQGGVLLLPLPASAPHGYGVGVSPHGQGQVQSGASPLAMGRQQHLSSPSGTLMVHQPPMAAPGLLSGAGTAPPALSTSLASLRCASSVLFFARTMLASLSSRPMDCIWPVLSLGLRGGGAGGPAAAPLLSFHDTGDPTLAGATELVADVVASCSALLELFAEVGSPLPFGRSPASLSLKVHVSGHGEKAKASQPSHLGCSGGWFGAVASALAVPGRDGWGSGAHEKTAAPGNPAKASPEQHRPSPGAPGTLRSSGGSLRLSSSPSFGSPSPRGKLGRRSSFARGRTGVTPRGSCLSDSVAACGYTLGVQALRLLLALSAQAEEQLQLGTPGSPTVCQIALPKQDVLHKLQDQGLEILEELGVASETQQKMSEEKWEGSPMLFSSSDSAQPTKAHVTTLAAELLESALALEAFQCRLRGPSSAPSFLRLDEMNQRLGRLHGDETTELGVILEESEALLRVLASM